MQFWVLRDSSFSGTRLDGSFGIYRMITKGIKTIDYSKHKEAKTIWTHERRII